MPVTIAQGPLGLEATHQWNGGVVLNDPAASSKYKIDSISGLHALPDMDDQRSPAIARHGEISFPTLSQGKTIVYEGRIMARTLGELRTAETTLRSSFGDRVTEKKMVISPNATYGGGSHPTWNFTGKVMQLDIEDVQNNGPTRYWQFQRGFTLGIRMSDPRFYQENGPVDVSGAASVSVTNNGNAPVDPTITVTGAGTSFTVSRGSLTLSFANLPVTGDVMLNFRDRTATIGATDVTAALLVADSNWWDAFQDGIPPGTHTISQTGGSGIRVQFSHASW